MAQSSEQSTPEEGGEDYELMPHKDVLELRDELRKLKMHPNEKTLQLSMVELASKVDKLADIFEEAMHEIRLEEAGLTFQDKMKPLIDRMEKILEQNSQIAEGVVAIADMVSELKELMGGGQKPIPEVGANQGFTPSPGSPPPMPPPRRF